MEKYVVFEGFIEDLRKKVATIQRKCERYGCDFHYAEVGEEYRKVPDPNCRDPFTGKIIDRLCRFVVVEADGTAIVNGWEFIASVEHTDKGNIFSKALSATDIEIPVRYRESAPFCEHCNSNRNRVSTFIVRNTETGEFKQVGKNCLCDYTHGMSASCASYLASVRTIFKEAEEEYIGGSGWWYSKKYYDTDEVLRYTAETIRRFGYSKSDNIGDSTRDRVERYLDFIHGNTRFWDDDFKKSVRREIEDSAFNPESEEARQMVDEAVAWLDTEEAVNDYMHNIKVAVALECATHIGLLVSLFPTYNRELEYQAIRKAEAEQGKSSEFVGNIGDRVSADIESVKCITSWESCFDGYHTTTTYVWKLTGKDGNIYTWKTSTYLDESKPPVSIKGTVKEHKTFREVKQTELTRCKVARA